MRVIFFFYFLVSCAAVTKQSSSSETSQDRVPNFRLIGCKPEKLHHIHKLKALVSESLRLGIQCLNNHARKQDAEELTALISDRPISLSCAPKEQNIIARALTRRDENFPGIELNPEDYLKQEGPATILHESLHWLGYSHFSDIDIPYLAEMCCFDNIHESQNLACTLLSNKNLKWTDEEYIKKFTSALKENDSGQIGIRTAWNATKSLKNKSSDLIYLSARELSQKTVSGQYSNSFISIVFMQATLPQLSKKRELEAQEILKSTIKRYYLPTEQEKVSFSLTLGDVISGILQNKKSKVEEAWEHLKSFRPKVCLSLSNSEKDQLFSLSKITAVGLFDVQPRLNPEILIGWENICQFEKSASIN